MCLEWDGIYKIYFFSVVPSCIRRFSFFVRNWIIIFLSFHLRLNIFFLFYFFTPENYFFSYFFSYSNEIPINFNELFQGFTYFSFLHSILFISYSAKWWVIFLLSIFGLVKSEKNLKNCKIHKLKFQFSSEFSRKIKLFLKKIPYALREDLPHSTTFWKRLCRVFFFIRMNSEQHTKKIVHVQLLLLEAPLLRSNSSCYFHIFSFFLSLSPAFFHNYTFLYCVVLFFFHPLWRIFNYFAPSILHTTQRVSEIMWKFLQDFFMFLSRCSQRKLQSNTIFILRTFKDEKNSYQISFAFVLSHK